MLSKNTDKNPKIGKYQRLARNQELSNVTVTLHNYLLSRKFKNSVKNKEMAIFKNFNKVHKIQRAYLKLYPQG